MIEIGESIFIEDKEYLKNYYLVDIPGLNEYKESIKFTSQTYLKKYSSIEKEMKDYNPENELNYLTEIFKIIKNKVNNGIILFNIDNYYHTENYRIIGKLRKIINKPIENFLILLNKIDKSENIQNDFNNLRGKIMEYFPSAKDFNFIKNTILPCSILQLENEFKMDKNFKNLIYFHYLNFIMKSKQSKSRNNINATFIDFLKQLISRRKITKNNLIKKINEIIENKNCINILSEIKSVINFIKLEHLDEDLNLGVRDDEFNLKEIKEIIEELKEEEENEENEDFNINEQKGNIIILFLYSEFKNRKQIPPKSRVTLEIINYFSLNQNKFNFDINTIIDYIFNIKLYDYIYIPLFGVSNAGKSTVLNCIMGYNLLPCHRNECTKKGIIIKYWNKDFPVIRKTYLKKLKKIYQKYIYTFRPDEKIIAKGIDDIKKILEGANETFLEDEEDYFYEINIKMKMIYESNMDDILKEKICFIDLPGFGTNNEFEKRNIYSKLNFSFGNFIFVIYNLKIKENDNQKMLKNLYETMPKDMFINNGLFVINSDKDQDTSEKSIQQAKKDIIQSIQGLDFTNINKINVCFFNAKYYENYLYKLNYYNSSELLIEIEYDQFINSNENFWKGFGEKQVNFNRYLKEKLNNNIKNDISANYNEKLIQSYKSYEREIKQISEKNNYSFKDKDIEQIAKYISFAKNNIDKSILLSKSNINVFEEKFITWIKNLKKKEKEDINENMYIEIKGTKNVPKGTIINIFTYGKEKYNNYIDESKHYIKNKCVTISIEIGLSNKLTQEEKNKNINEFVNFFNDLLNDKGHLYLRKITYQNVIFDYIKELKDSKFTKDYFNLAFLKLYKPFSLNLKTDFNFNDLITCTPEEIILKLLTCILKVEGDDTYSKELMDSFFKSKFFTTIFKSSLSYFFNLKLEYNVDYISNTNFYKSLTALLSSYHGLFNNLEYISGWIKLFFNIFNIYDSKEKIIYDLFGINLFNNIKIWFSIPDYKIGLCFNMNNIYSNTFFEELIERRLNYYDDNCNII